MGQKIQRWPGGYHTVKDEATWKQKGFTDAGFSCHQAFRLPPWRGRHCDPLFAGVSRRPACSGREMKIVFLKSHSSYALLKLPKKEIHWTWKEGGRGGQHRKIRSPYHKLLACSAVFQMGLKLINCNSLILCDHWKALGIWVWKANEHWEEARAATPANWWL